MSARVAAAAPFPGNVHAFTTLRHGAGASRPPFDSFNLGNFRGEGGDDPAVVARNRMELFERFGLPSWPHWLRQVHGTRVLRFDAPCPPPGLPPRCAQGRRPGARIVRMTGALRPMLSLSRSRGRVGVGAVMPPRSPECPPPHLPPLPRGEVFTFVPRMRGARMIRLRGIAARIVRMTGAMRRAGRAGVGAKTSRPPATNPKPTPR